MADRSCDDDVGDLDASKRRSKRVFVQFYLDTACTERRRNDQRSDSSSDDESLVSVSGDGPGVTCPGGGPNVTCPGVRSLQEAFLQYQKRKQREIRRAVSRSKRHSPRSSEAIARPVANPDRMMALRHKFVERAKHYFGVPYARKYWTPDDPEYHSRLFLDCCGLVRRVVRDLRTDFGFRLGPWNQAYMYDTLPITRDHPREMLPGDLVFISATYYNEKSKKQKHNMTHVEIWLGEGHKTIGARWQKGKVQVFDNYKFQAKSYHSETYIFKSIDTWLKGICRSHCSEHQWKRRSSRPFTPSNRSIFHHQAATPSPAAVESKDESAGDTDSELVAVGTQTESVTTMDASTSASFDDVASIEDDVSTVAEEDVRLEVWPANAEETKVAPQDQQAWSLADVQGRYIPTDLTSACFIETGKRDVSFAACDDRVPREPCAFNVEPATSAEDVANTDKPGSSAENEDNTWTEKGVEHNKSVIHEDHKVPAVTDGNLDNTRWAFVTTLAPSENKTASDEPSEVTGSAWRAINPSNLVLSLSATETKYAGFSGRLCAKSKSANSLARESAIAAATTRSHSTSCIDNLTAVVRIDQQHQQQQQHTSDDHMTVPVAPPSDAGDTPGDKPKDHDAGDDTPPPTIDRHRRRGKQKTRRSNKGDKNDDGRTPTPRKSVVPMIDVDESTFYISDACNGVALVREGMEDMGWTRVESKQMLRAQLIWIEMRTELNYNMLHTGEQLVNRIPNTTVLANKLHLLLNLQRFERVCLCCPTKFGLRILLCEIMPETYRLDDMADRRRFLDVYREGEIWICKPAFLNQGRGIFLVKDSESIHKNIQAIDEMKANPYNCVSGARIIQRYITDPLLLDGRKFDIRAYMLIACTKPYLVLYHKGYVRLSLLPYSTGAEDLAAHLTNQGIQRRNRAYATDKETTVWSMDSFNDYINEKVAPYRSIERNWVYTVFEERIKQIMLHCFEAAKYRLDAKLGYFELYGFDFMVDNNFTVWLIEVNANPCLATNCVALREILPGVIKETLGVVVECFRKSQSKRPLMPLEARENFEVLYDTESKTSTLLPHICPPPELVEIAKEAMINHVQAKSAAPSPTPEAAAALATKPTTLFWYIRPTTMMEVPESIHSLVEKVKIDANCVSPERLCETPDELALCQTKCSTGGNQLITMTTAKENPVRSIENVFHFRMTDLIKSHRGFALATRPRKRAIAECKPSHLEQTINEILGQTGSGDVKSHSETDNRDLHDQTYEQLEHSDIPVRIHDDEEGERKDTTGLSDNKHSECDRKDCKVSDIEKHDEITDLPANMYNRCDVNRDIKDYTVPSGVEKHDKSTDLSANKCNPCDVVGCEKDRTGLEKNDENVKLLAKNHNQYNAIEVKKECTTTEPEKHVGVSVNTCNESNVVVDEKDDTVSAMERETITIPPVSKSNHTDVVKYQEDCMVIEIEQEDKITNLPNSKDNHTDVVENQLDCVVTEIEQKDKITNLPGSKGNHTDVVENYLDCMVPEIEQEGKITNLPGSKGNHTDVVKDHLDCMVPEIEQEDKITNLPGSKGNQSDVVKDHLNCMVPEIEREDKIINLPGNKDNHIDVVKGHEDCMVTEIEQVHEITNLPASKGNQFYVDEDHLDFMVPEIKQEDKIANLSVSKGNQSYVVKVKQNHVVPEIEHEDKMTNQPTSQGNQSYVVEDQQNGVVHEIEQEIKIANLSVSKGNQTDISGESINKDLTISKLEERDKNIDYSTAECHQAGVVGENNRAVFALEKHDENVSASEFNLHHIIEDRKFNGHAEKTGNAAHCADTSTFPPFENQVKGKTIQKDSVWNEKSSGYVKHDFDVADKCNAEGMRENDELSMITAVSNFPVDSSAKDPPSHRLESYNDGTDALDGIEILKLYDCTKRNDDGVEMSQEPIKGQSLSVVLPSASRSADDFSTESDSIESVGLDEPMPSKIKITPDVYAEHSLTDLDTTSQSNSGHCSATCSSGSGQSMTGIFSTGSSGSSEDKSDSERLLDFLPPILTTRVGDDTSPSGGSGSVSRIVKDQHPDWYVGWRRKMFQYGSYGNGHSAEDDIRLLSGMEFETSRSLSPAVSNASAVAAGASVPVAETVPMLHPTGTMHPLLRAIVPKRIRAAIIRRRVHKKEGGNHIFGPSLAAKVNVMGGRVSSVKGSERRKQDTDLITYRRDLVNATNHHPWLSAHCSKSARHLNSVRASGSSNSSSGVQCEFENLLPFKNGENAPRGNSSRKSPSRDTEIPPICTNATRAYSSNEKRKYDRNSAVYAACRPLSNIRSAFGHEIDTVVCYGRKLSYHKTTNRPTKLHDSLACVDVKGKTAMLKVKLKENAHGN